MDLELSDEQTVAERVARRRCSPREAAARRGCGRRLVDFGALSVGGDDGLGAVELCLIARALGAHLAPVPYLGSAAVRFAAEPLAADRRRRRGARAARAGSELGAAPSRRRPTAGGPSSPAARPPSSTPASVQRLAVVAAAPQGPVLGDRRRRRRPAVALVPQPAFDADGADVRGRAAPTSPVLGGAARAAQAISPADDDRRAARGRRGRRSGRAACSTTPAATPPSAASSAARSAASRRCATCWRTCTCARPARGRRSSTRRPRSTRTPRTRARTASIAKAYVSRAAREVAHGAMQVFGGIAVTAEHPAHRYLRRIVVRERQFGDARPPRAGARPGARGRRRPGAGGLMAPATASGFNDPTAQRLERISTGAEPEVVGPLLAEALHDPRWLHCDVALISGGKSNLTYRVACDAGEVVLRRPPLGHVLPTAHDMVREHRVLHALDGTAVPVPRVLHLGRADGPLGVDFYVMERVLGHVCRNALPPGYADGPEPRAAIGAALVDVLADLHAVDPAAVGLDGLRPAGRLRRAPAAPLVASSGTPRRPASCPALDELRDELVRTLPPPARRRDRPRRLPARQHRAAPDVARPHRRRARLGDEHARRPA